MVSPNNTGNTAAHGALVDEFKTSLLAHDLTDVIRRHITTGEPVALKGEEYFRLRRVVAHEFSLHPSAVVVVGSCRLGFTLKKVRGHSYRPLRNDSDVDVAVVSTSLFEMMWDAVFAVTYANRNWPLERGNRFTRDLYSGWIAPGSLPASPPVEPIVRWSEFFERLTRERICGLRTISGRLYRTWDRLEAYQRFMAQRCLNELKSTR